MGLTRDTRPSGVNKYTARPSKVHWLLEKSSVKGSGLIGKLVMLNKSIHVELT